MDTRETQPRMTSSSGENAKSDHIKAQIDSTRARMDNTLDALTQRLNPRSILDDVLGCFRGSGSSQMSTERIKDFAGSTGRVLLRQIQEHPLPSLMIGAGLVWMAMDRGRKYDVYLEEEDEFAEIESPVYSETEVEFETDLPEESPMMEGESESHEAGIMDRAKEKGQQLKAKFASTAEAAREKGRQMKERVAAGAQSMRSRAAGAAASVGEMARHAGERASHEAHRIKETAAQRAQRLKESAAYRAQRLKESTQEMTHHLRSKASDAYHVTGDKFNEATENYPLAVGVGFLALGLLAGLAIPRTRREDRMLGERADELRERAKMRGKEMLEKGQRAAMAAMNAASEEAKAQGLTSENIKSKIGQVAGDIKEAAMESARREGFEAESMKEKAQRGASEAKTVAREEAGKTGGSGEGTDYGSAGTMGIQTGSATGSGTGNPPTTPGNYP